MEPSCSRFTPAEGGARLANTSHEKNLLVADHTTFIALRLLHEEAYSIRGSLFDGKKRSVYITRASRVKCTSYDVNLLTDLSVVSAINYDDVIDWRAELDKKEVVVCTSAVIRRIIEEDLLSMLNINVIIIDSCHLISKDDSLKFIMHLYKTTCDTKKPRILALTYPLFGPKVEEPQNDTETETSTTENENDDTKNEYDESKSENDISKNELDKVNDGNNEKDNHINIEIIKSDTKNENDITVINKETEKSKKYDENSEKSTVKCNNKPEDTKNDIDSFGNENDTKKKPDFAIGAYENLDDFDMYEKLEWKLDALENELCCEADLAEDIDGIKRSDSEYVSDSAESVSPQPPPPPPKKVTKKKATAAVATTPVVNTAATKRKVAESTPSSSSSNKKKLESHTDAGSAPTPRLSPAITKPRELIVEFSEQKDRSLLPNSYVDVENYMRSCIEDVMLFLEDHRYDPMEIYGEDLYDELIKIPDPTIDPKLILHQFLYVLDELGPYAADKAAFALLAKLEKLRIKVPYERHFLLLCICTTVFVKIRCYADLVFAEFESDWEKIRRFSTPKLLRFIGILEKFKPPNLSSKNEIDTENRDQNDTFMSSNEMLKAVENCDFVSLGNEIEDTINAYEANLKDIPDFKLIKDSKPFDTELDQNNTNSDIPKGTENIITSQNENSKCKKHTNRDENEANKNENDTIKNENDTTTNENDTTTNENDNISQSDTNPTDSGKSDLNARKNIMLGFTRRYGNRLRGRGRNLRTNAMKTQQNQQNPDALCGIVFMKEPFMAKILFNLIVDLSRSHPSLSFLSAQYSAIERLADPVKEPKDFETQRKKQEDVLKKFRMHECNLLLATSILEEGIDLPRCNLVIRWDVPTCYRSHALCKCRCRAARASCVLLSRARPHTAPLVDHLATYTQIDQIISRKCGCGIQDEPSQSEEESADIFTPCIQAYTTQNYIKSDSDKIRNEDDIIKSENDVIKRENDINESDIDIKNSCDISEELSISENCDQLVILNKNIQINTNTCESLVVIDITANKSDSEILISKDDIILNENDKIVSQNENNGACVDLGSAIALINRYCGKLPSDTFTRLAPQWWMEKVSLPCREEAGTLKTAYICTLRLPLNCPVKFNIVGHPMPSRILARRIVALQAARILHKSGELDHNLMPISKENFQSVELDIGVPPKWQTKDDQDPNDIARPGTTKRRQYYYKKTARAFTDCEPQINATDEEILKPFNPEMLTDNASAVTNRLVSISCVLQCALPERYNTRGRRLHAPQHAAQALALLLATRAHTHRMQIPQFPVYTRSGEVRVSLKHVPNADTRLSPHRQTRILRFMRFVFSEVLRVRRKGMRLDPKGCTHNNYYVVPTIKTTKEDGSSQIDIDWDFLEVIYNYTENKIRNNLGKPTSWQDDENYDDNDSDYSNRNENDNTYSKNDTYNDSIECEKDMSGKSADVDIKEDNSTIKHENDLKTKDIDIDNSCKDKNSKTLDVNEKTNIGNKHQMNNDNKKSENVYEKTLDNQNENVNSRNDKYNSGNNRKVVKKMDNPFLKPGEVFVFDPEKYKEAVVTPWYRNQDQPQFFLVAEICWSLTPDSAFPSATHTSFRSYYLHKYGVDLTQADQPLLDVDHTSARLNLLTPRYVNRKGVALPVSSERTRRNKRDRLDQKQILLPELCHTHPFPAPLWFATVALPAILYRVNALLIADEIRENVAIEASLGVPKITDPDFQWPPLHFGWSLEEVLNADSEKYDSNRTEKKKDENTDTILGKEESASMERETETHQDANEAESVKEKTINDVLQEKEDAESGFEIGMWSNEMASAIPESTEYDELMEPLPSNLTFCTSASGGTNWCSPVDTKNYTSGKTFSMADSDCSYMSSDFDTDDSDLNSGRSDEETESSGFGSTRYTNAALGVRIEYKTAHEAEAVDLDNKKQVNLGPKPSARDDYLDRREQESYLREGCVPEEYKEKFHTSVEKHKHVIIDNCIIKEHEDIIDILPQSQINGPNKSLHQNQGKKTLLDQLFPYGTAQSEDIFKTEQLTLETLEKNKKILMAELKKTLPESEIKKMNCFSMIDVDTDTAVKHDALKSSKAELSSKKLSDKDNFATNKNVDFDCDRLGKETDGWDEFKPYYKDDCGLNGKTFDFDYQPNLEGHPGPSPSLILQALTMSNANDGINLERLETIGDSFLKLAITTRLYCAHPNVHEGKLSHMRSKQVSNLNLYRLGRNKNLGTLMIASKFEPHDNWLPPCHKPPSPAHFTEQMDSQEKANISGASASNDGCFIPYNLITQHSIPDKSIADCVEALIGAYLLACGPRGALLFMCWLGLTVLPTLSEDTQPQIPKRSRCHSETDDGSVASDNEGSDDISARCTKIKRPVYGELKPPSSPLLRYIADPEGELERMLSGYEVLEETLQYRFRDRSLLLQSMTHASHQTNRLTDCYQRLEFLGDAILDYLITRHLFLDARRHSPGALTDLRSALVNNTIFATLAVRHHFHKFFRHMSPGLNEVLTKYVKIQEENGHSISEEHYLIQEDEMEQAEDVEVPKALGDLFESVAGAIFLDSGMSLSAVWRSYERLMRLELEAFSAAAPKSPVRELLEQEPDTAKFGKPERLADGRRVRVKVEVFGRGTFKGIGRNYRIAKGTAARCALRHLKSYNNR